MPAPSVPLAAIRQPAFLYDARGRIVAANDRVETLAGRSLVDLSAPEMVALLDIRSPDGTSLAPADLPSSRALRGEEVVEEPFTVARPDGRSLEIVATATPVCEGHSITGALVLWQDVTERVRAEVTLRESEARFRAVQENSLDRFTILRPIRDDRGEIVDFAYVYQNARAARTAGHRPEDLAGRRMTEIFPTFPQTRFFAMYKSAVETGQGMQFEEHYSADGVDDWFRTTVTPIPDGIAISTEIVTEQRRAEAALRESEERFRSILESISDSFMAMDREWRLTFINRRALGYRGHRPADVIGKTIWESFPEIVGTPLETFYRTAMEHEEPMIFENSSVVATGRSFELHAYPSGDGLSIFGQDITERKRAEEALRESEARYRMLHESLRDAFVMTAMDGPIIECNDLYCELLGYSPEEMRTLMYRDLTPERWHAMEERIVQEQILPRGYSDVYEMEYRRKDGTVIPVELRTMLARDDEGEPAAMWATVRDVTERKQAERELAASEAKYRELFESMSEGFLLVEPILDERGVPISYRYLDANPALERLTHLERDDLIGRDVRDVLPGVEPYWIETFGRVALTGEPTQIEEYSQDLSGWYNVHVYCPKPGTAALVYTNISERKRAEEALLQSEAKYRTLFDSIDEGFFVIDVLFDENDRPVDLYYVEANDAATRMLGQDWAGKRLTELSPDYEPYWFEIFGNVARTGESVRLERYAAPDRRWYSFYVFRIGGPESRRIGNTFLDITERKQMEEALAGVNRILSAALTSESEEALGEVCLAVAEEITQSGFGFIGEVNENGLEDIAISNPGWDACAAITPAGHRRPPGNFALRGLFGRVLTEGRSLIANDPATHPDRVGIPAGHPPLTAFLGVPLLRDGRIAGMIGVANRTDGYTEAEQRLLEAVAPAITDAIERFRAAQNLRHYATDLERSNADLERFAYVSSHDLQEPLRSIVSFSQLLERRYRGKLGQDADEYIEFIVEGGNRMQTLIQDLLAYSRVNSKAQELRPTDVEAVMAAVERNLDHQLREVGAIITFDPLPTVTADPLQLEQVFVNLVSNAIRFRRQDEPLRIHIGARRLDGLWEFSVQDNGIGIEAEYFDRIFVIFQRLHTKDVYPGTGIGLAIVKRIVDRHGGRCRVESTPGEGSTFFFTLPDGSFKNGGGGNPSPGHLPTGQ